MKWFEVDQKRRFSFSSGRERIERIGKNSRLTFIQVRLQPVLRATNACGRELI